MFKLTLGPVYTKRQRLGCNEMFSLKTMEWLQNGCNPFWSDFIVFNESSMASVITALWQSCDVDAQCKRALLKFFFFCLWVKQSCVLCCTLLICMKNGIFTPTTFTQCICIYIFYSYYTYISLNNNQISFVFYTC